MVMIGAFYRLPCVVSGPIAACHVCLDFVTNSWDQSANFLDFGTFMQNTTNEGPNCKNNKGLWNVIDQK
jgi:hypothetical protein